MWLPSNYNNVPVTLGSGFQAPLAAAVPLIVICWTGLGKGDFVQTFNWNRVSAKTEDTA